jgi:hypothetical protein
MSFLVLLAINPLVLTSSPGDLYSWKLLALPVTATLGVLATPTYGMYRNCSSAPRKFLTFTLVATSAAGLPYIVGFLLALWLVR